MTDATPETEPDSTATDDSTPLATRRETLALAAGGALTTALPSGGFRAGDRQRSPDGDAARADLEAVGVEEALADDSSTPAWIRTPDDALDGRATVTNVRVARDDVAGRAWPVLDVDLGLFEFELTLSVDDAAALAERLAAATVAADRRTEWEE